MADPEECRSHAQACIDLANNAKDTRAQKVYFDLARNWIKLAMALERTYGLTDSNEVVAPKQAN